MREDRVRCARFEGPSREPAVVPEGIAHPKPPQRRRAQLAAGRVALFDEVGGEAHVVQQEVGVGVQHLVADRGLEILVVLRDESRDVAGGTADVVEVLLAAHPRPRGLRRRREKTLEVGHTLDEGQALAVRDILGIGDLVALRQPDRVAVRGVLVADDGIRDSHLVERGISGKGGHRRQLRLPAETADGGPGRILEDRHDVRSTADADRRVRRILLDVGARDRFDQTEAERRVRQAQGGDVGHRRNDLGALSADRLVLQEGAPEILERVETATPSRRCGRSG